MADGSSLLGEGPLPGEVHVPSYVAIDEDKLIWSWLHPDAVDPYQGEIDFQKFVALTSVIPAETSSADMGLEFLQQGRPHYKEPKGMLNAFTRIKNLQDVVRFARRFGVLGICHHGLPDTHDMQCQGSAITAGRTVCRH